MLFFLPPSLLSFLVRKSAWRACCSLELSFPAEVSSSHRCSQRETSLWAVTQPENTQNGHALSLGLRFSERNQGPLEWWPILGLEQEVNQMSLEHFVPPPATPHPPPQKKEKTVLNKWQWLVVCQREEPIEGLQSPKLSKYEAWHTSELNLIVCAWSNNLGNKIK